VYACVTRPVRVCDVTWLVGIHNVMTVWMSRHLFSRQFHRLQWVMRQIWMSHVTRTSESCLTCISCESLLSHTQMSHGTRVHATHVNESDSYSPSNVTELQMCWVLSHVWMTHVTRVNHVTHVNDSCHTCQWVMSKIWVCHVTHIYASYCTPRWVDESSHAHAIVISRTWIYHECI